MNGFDHDRKRRKLMGKCRKREVDSIYLEEADDKIGKIIDDSLTGKKKKPSLTRVSGCS